MAATRLLVGLVTGAGACCGGGSECSTKFRFDVSPLLLLLLLLKVTEVAVPQRELEYDSLPQSSNSHRSPAAVDAVVIVVES